MHPPRRPPTSTRHLRRGLVVVLAAFAVALGGLWTRVDTDAEASPTSSISIASITTASTTTVSTLASPTSVPATTTSVAPAEATEVATDAATDADAAGTTLSGISGVIETGLEMADPTVLTVGSGYVAAGTNMERDGELLNVPAAVSSDLTTWTGYVDLLPTLPSWAEEGYTWAPSLVLHDGVYELYFAALDAASGRLCIGVATSSDPLGPYVSSADEPLVCQDDLGGSIDPEVVTVDGRRWLLWKNDGNCCDVEVRLWAQQLEGGSLVGSRVVLLSADADWEGGVVENPTALVTGDTVQLLYSANAWDSADYGTGWATCLQDWLVCTKHSRSSAALEDLDGTAGGGGASVFIDADGDPRIIWAAWSLDDSGRLTRRAIVASVEVAAG